MKKRVLKISLIVFVLFLIVREFLPFNISLYNRKNDWHSNTSYHSDMSFNQGYVYTDEKCVDLVREKNVALLYTGLNIDKQEIEMGGPIINVDVSSTTSVGILRFLPLYKPFTFSSNNSYTWTVNACYRNGLYSIMGTGNVEITGTEKIFGICSAKQAQKIIEQVIAKELDRQVSNHIEGQFQSVVND